MKKLKVFKKKDGTEFQTLDFSKATFGFGNVMTVIFSNVEVQSTLKKTLWISQNVGMMGDNRVIRFVPKKGKFELEGKLDE